MGRIQSNIGLITGLPIADTVAQLMQIAARPREMLAERTESLREEQIAVTELSALLAGVQYAVTNLGKGDLYDQRTVTSSNPDVLAATITGDPAKGSYQFTPLRMAQCHQLLSSRFGTDTGPLGAGVFRFRFGAGIRPSVDLDTLGGGQGVVRGDIRITDRSGASAVIDLSSVQTVDDVLEAINGHTVINVAATAEGDRLRLEDLSGQAVSNLRVQEVGQGTTAASLGLAGIDVAADVADGQDRLWLAEALPLDLLNDGNGVFIDRILSDVQYVLRDGTTGTIDLSPIIAGSSEVDDDTTLGDVLQRINAAEPDKLRVEIAPDGDRLIITDLTEGSGAFALTSLGESTALEDLGLDAPAVDGVITGRRILGGLQSVLLASLEGGQGVGTLGLLSLTDRSGATDTVDLSAAETLDDVIGLINAAGVGIVAQVNPSANGIQLVDTTGGSAGNLIVADADETATAGKLGVAVDADVTSVDSGDLHLRIISRNTSLSDLNGGAGVARDRLTIYDTTGQHAQLSLRSDRIQTIHDVIRAINRLGLQVQAELNEIGDGIRIRDLAHGAQTLRVVEGSSTTAGDLHLLGEAVEVEIDGEMTQVIEGSTTLAVQIDQTDCLTDLRDKINALNAGVTATILYDGSSRPFRLALQSDQAGPAGKLLVDTSGVDFSFQEAARAQHALLVLGDPAAGSNVLLSSSSNTFEDVIPGVRLEIKQPSLAPVTVTVDATHTNLIAGVDVLVENYNRFRDKLDELTRYDMTTDTGSVLTGDATALRLDMDLTYLLSGRLDGAGSIKSLREVGIRLKEDGTLEFDPSKLEAKLAEDPEALRRFFADKKQGLSAKFGKLVERLSGQHNSLLAERLKVLSDKIQKNEEKIAFFDARLNRQQDRLLLEFYQLELVVGRMQSNLAALEALQPLPPLTSTRER